MVGGQVAASAGTPLFANDDPLPDWLRGTIRISAGFSERSFRVEVPETAPSRVWVQAMEMYDGYFKRAFHCELPVVEGNAVADPKRDVLKVAVVDRHHASDHLGLGFVRGFGLRSGAIAISTNCTNQNVVVVGASDADMAAAVASLRRLDGGVVVVDHGATVASMPLPLAGIMSDQPWEAARDQLRAAEAAAATLGCPVPSPFMILSFIGLAGIPDLGLTELGLVETATQTFTPVTLGHERTALSCRCPSHVYAVHHLMDSVTAGADGRHG
jgi:adenine deaminase